MNNKKFTITSSAFDHSKAIPSKYANTGVLGGKNISLPLSWEHPPKETKSFAISIVDVHSVANNWVHWLVVNIPSNVDSLFEGASTTSKLPAGAKELNNTWGVVGYGGPQPPKGSGAHRYEVTVYALSVDTLELDVHTSLTKFKKAIDGHVIAMAKTIGVFERM
ncbi:MAG: YbhB/YbcL family Raf kinase inhibitor-like protein [Ignavibacteriae bacterium]|nr:YbhB/YbcL family Raf kinase inhibitor-like protein [Ignavibacteriota bacterium]